MPRHVSKQTKNIMKYTDQGMTANEIAKKLKIGVQAVHNVRYRERKKVERSMRGGGIASVKRTNNAETGIVTLAQTKNKPNVATPKSVEPAPKPIEDVKPSIWTRIKRVLTWR